MLKQVLLVLVCCAFVTVRGSNPCLGAPAHLPHSFAAAPESCDAYIICMGGQTIRGQRCPAGHDFEPVTQVCGQSSCMDCSPFGIQNLPFPTNCEQFIECIMGTRTIRTCPNDLRFDRNIGHCNYANEIQCPHDPVTPDPWEPITPDPWEPITPDPWEPTTPNPWDPTTPNPWDPTTPSPNLPVCTPGQVHHAHPTDCTRFFMCVNMVLWEQQCPSGLHWNQRVISCDRPESAGCIVPTGPTDPTGFPTEPSLIPPTTVCPPLMDEELNADNEASVAEPVPEA